MLGGRASPESAEAADVAGSRPGGLASRFPRLAVALAVIAAVLVLASPLWAPVFMRRLAFFRVRRVEILGSHYVAPNDILARLRVDTTVSVWDPTTPLAARIATNVEIRTAVVRRKLPGTLVVEVTERVPVALVPAKGGFLVYDERGLALPIDPARVGVDAPVLLQRDVPLLRLLGVMRERMPALYVRVSAVRRSGRDELIFQLESWPVRAMQNVTLERLAELDPVERDLARKQLRVVEIDLRYRDQVIARLQ